MISTLRTYPLPPIPSHVPALPLGHGFSPQASMTPIANVFNPSYPFLINLYELCIRVRVLHG